MASNNYWGAFLGGLSEGLEKSKTLQQKDEELRIKQKELREMQKRNREALLNTMMEKYSLTKLEQEAKMGTAFPQGPQNPIPFFNPMAPSEGQMRNFGEQAYENIAKTSTVASPAREGTPEEYVRAGEGNDVPEGYELKRREEGMPTFSEDKQGNITPRGTFPKGSYIRWYEPTETPVQVVNPEAGTVQTIGMSPKGAKTFVSNFGSKPLSTGQFQKLDSYAKAYTRIKEILADVKENKYEMGPAYLSPDNAKWMEGSVGNAAMQLAKDPKASTFKKSALRFFNTYRTEVTGAAAAFSELTWLQSSVPLPHQDTTENYVAGMEKLKQEYTVNLQNVMTYLKESGNAVPASLLQARNQVVADSPELQGYSPSTVEVAIKEIENMNKKNKSDVAISPANILKAIEALGLK